MNNDGNDQTINWNIDVDRNMTRFNKSGGEEPVIQVEYSKPGIQGFGCLCYSIVAEISILLF